MHPERDELDDFQHCVRDAHSCDHAGRTSSGCSELSDLVGEARAATA